MWTQSRIRLLFKILKWFLSQTCVDYHFQRLQWESRVDLQKEIDNELAAMDDSSKR